MPMVVPPNELSAFAIVAKPRPYRWGGRPRPGGGAEAVGGADDLFGGFPQWGEPPQIALGGADGVPRGAAGPAGRPPPPEAVRPRRGGVRGGAPPPRHVGPRAGARGA